MANNVNMSGREWSKQGDGGKRSGGTATARDIQAGRMKAYVSKEAKAARGTTGSKVSRFAKRKFKTEVRTTSRQMKRAFKAGGEGFKGGVKGVGKAGVAMLKGIGKRHKGMVLVPLALGGAAYGGKKAYDKYR